MNDIFLHFCEIAEEKQSLSLARYLTWLCHNSDHHPYLASLWDIQGYLTLVVWPKEKDDRRRTGGHPLQIPWMFDLSGAE